MKRTLILAAGLFMVGLSAPCHAQNSDYENAILGQSMQARVGVTIPFGGDGKSSKFKPQLALIGRRSQLNKKSLDWAMKQDFVQNDYVETRLALTLASKPGFLLNGQSLNFGDELRAGGNNLNALDNYDKGVLTVIGVSLVVIAGSIIILSD